MRALVIDDERKFVDQSALDKFGITEVRYVISATAGKRLLEQQWDLVFLDHDLGSTRGTGMDVVTEMARIAFEDERMPCTTVYVHTANPSAAPMMVKTLDRYGYDVKRIHAEDHGLLAMDEEGPFTTIVIDTTREESDEST